MSGLIHGCNVRAVGAKDGMENCPCVTFKARKLGASRRVPHAGGSVVRSGDDPRAIRAERCRGYVIRVAAKGGDLSASCRVPHFVGLIETGCCDPGFIRAIGDIAHPEFMTDEVEKSGIKTDT